MKLKENRTNIHPLNRAQLLKDSAVFAKQKKLNVLIFLNLLETWKCETDLIAWYPGIMMLDTIRKEFLTTEYNPSVKVLVFHIPKISKQN